MPMADIKFAVSASDASPLKLLNGFGWHFAQWWRSVHANAACPILVAIAPCRGPARWAENAVFLGQQYSTMLLFGGHYFENGSSDSFLKIDDPSQFWTAFLKMVRLRWSALGRPQGSHCVSRALTNLFIWCYNTGWAKLNGANAVSFVENVHVLENFDNFWQVK